LNTAPTACLATSLALDPVNQSPINKVDPLSILLRHDRSRIISIRLSTAEVGLPGTRPSRVLDQVAVLVGVGKADGPDVVRTTGCHGMKCSWVPPGGVGRRDCPRSPVPMDGVRPVDGPIGEVRGPNPPDV